MSQTHRLSICPALKAHQDGGELIYKDTSGAHERNATCECELSCRKHGDMEWTCHTRTFVHSASWENFEKYFHTWIVIAPSSLVFTGSNRSRQAIGNWARWGCMCLLHGSIDEPNKQSSIQMVYSLHCSSKMSDCASDRGHKWVIM